MHIVSCDVVGGDVEMCGIEYMKQGSRNTGKPKRMTCE